MSKRSRKFWCIFFIILFISLGFSYISSSLNILGNTSISRNTWNVYWNNINVTEGSVSGTSVTTPATISNDKTEVSFSVVLSVPGEFYEFTVDAVNGGTIDAMIESIHSLLNGVEITTLPSYLKYVVTYVSDNEIEENDLLAAGTTETYKVRVEFKRDIQNNQLPSTDQSLSYAFSIDYIQATSAAQQVSHLAYFCCDATNSYNISYPEVIPTFFANVTDYQYEYGMTWYDYYNSEYFNSSVFMDTSTTPHSFNLPWDFLYYDKRHVYVSDDNSEYVETYNDYVSTDKIMPKSVGCYGSHIYFGE